MSAFEKIVGMFPNTDIGEDVAREILREHARELAQKQRERAESVWKSTDGIEAVLMRMGAKAVADLIDPEMER